MIDYKITNKNTTLILCIFGGYLGLHHFYNKQNDKGILYLITAGLFGVGWIIDIIKIISIKENKENIIQLGRYCNNCGLKVNDSDNYCNNCGKLLNDHIIQRTNKSFSLSDDSNDDVDNISLYKRTKSRKLVDDYIVFDLETTGFYPKYDKIIEIGALKYKNNELIDKFNFLINPEEKLSKKITHITGITDEMLKDCKTIDVILPKFIDWIEDYTLIAHNGTFDLGFIETKINELNIGMINNKNIDTLYLSRKWITDTENHKLETLKKYFKLDYSSHRALEDCYVTNIVYQYCKNKKGDDKFEKYL